MREIKFRARGKNSNEYLNEGKGLTLKEIQNIYEIEEWDFEEYTGLKDKNGKEIFESDIVGMPYEFDDEQGFTGKPRAVVEHKKGSFTIKCFNGNRFDLFAEEGRLEVFGNIHENPGLLEVK